jgi:short-subunit dehydrogenase
MKNVALITGAASGIGKEFSKLHAQQGGSIVAVDMNSEGLKSLKSELENNFNIEVYTITKDLSRITSAQEIYSEVKTLNITIDYLINNAGFGGVGKFHERPLEQDLAMIQVNIIALTLLTRYFLPDFITRDFGKILNVSSTVSLLPGPGQAVYFASKAFVTSFSNAISGELENTNVSMTALLPGATQTAFGNHSGMNKTAIYKKPASAKDVATKGYEAMLRGDIEVIAGLPFSQKLELSLIPFIPKKALLKRVNKQQTF